MLSRIDWMSARFVHKWYYEDTPGSVTKSVKVSRFSSHPYRRRLLAISTYGGKHGISEFPEYFKTNNDFLCSANQLKAVPCN